MIPVTPTLLEYFRLETLGSYVRDMELLEVDGVLVDVANIVRRRYRCDTSCCLQTSSQQAHGSSLAGDCCHGPEVRLAAGEREGLLEHLPGIMQLMAREARETLAARLARHRRDPSLAFCRPVKVNGRPTGHLRLRQMPGGDCIFRFEGHENGRPFARCAVHAYLLQAGLPLWGIKPMTCWVWPLALVPLYDGHLLLTLHTLDSLMFTGEGRYHASRPCLTRPAPDAPFVYQATEHELRHLFGDRFYEHLLRAIEGRRAGERSG
ncbi:MAG: hypothetical protein QME94_04615 [Anaerolineae bacterium]|nr:hypothetical protein [Anaerolineae bacterium]